MKSNDYSTWLEIDLGAIRNNVQQLRTIAQTRVMAVVKANGYGHGAQAVAQAAEEAGAAWCGVARLDEALALRRAGISCRILVLGYTPPGRVPEALAHNITLTVYDPQTARTYAARAAAHGQNVRLHIKVETGMGRLGIPPEETVEFLRTFASHTGVEIEGIFTHFARADEPDADTTRQQLAIFQNALTALDAAGLRPALVHAANSAATLRFPAARFDMVRVGIALYGLPPAEECPLPAELQAALTWKARLTSVKQLAPGHGVSYGHR
ncbi:MAG: alanine racemase, partial [Gammaproteobacteria bacterium]|nr:alanine racemase [Gammaproteobacteria bacterium]